MVLRWLSMAALGAWVVGCGNEPAMVDDGGTGQLVDELSMPAEPTLDMSKFTSAKTCGQCHTQHYAEWKTSNHAYAMIDPVYRKLVQVRQDAFDGAQDKFCLQCHTAIGTRGGDIQPNFSFDELSDISLEGVTCEACHKVSELARPYNSGHVLDAEGPMRGPITDPEPNPFHESVHSPLHDTSAFCGGCHDIVEVSGINLERPFAEWLESPSAESEQNCQSCHMPSYQGEAVSGGRTRTLHRHRWVGVDVPFSEGFLTPDEEDDLRVSVKELLQGAASVDLNATEAGGTVNLYVTLTNNIPAHNFPTGSTFLRQAWVEVIARDANDNILFQTGHLDGNADLRNYYSDLDPFGDPDLLLLGSGFVTTEGDPTLFSWEASEHFSASISPLYDRTYTLFIPTAANTPGPITVTARIRFRAFPPYLLRALGLEQYLGKLEIHDVGQADISIPISAL